jgi:uncharacterized membrane protein YfcA
MNWLRFFVIGWGLPLSVYAALQAGALLSLRGRWRLAVAIPLPFMLLVTAHMAWACYKESNLWPMTMLMTAPGAALGVLVLWVTALLSSRRWTIVMVPVCICAVAILAASRTDPGIDILWTGPSAITVAAAFGALGVAVSQIARLIGGRRTTSGS